MKKKEVKKAEETKEVEQAVEKQLSQEDIAVRTVLKGFHRSVWMLKKALKRSSNAEELVKRFGTAVGKLNAEMLQMIQNVELEARIAAMSDGEKEYLKSLLD